MCILDIFILSRCILARLVAALAGVVGGALSCWYHPFEVARIEMQARAVSGEQAQGMLQVIRSVHAEYGLRGLFQGLLPRMGLNIWLTLFMVSGVNLLKQAREGEIARQLQLPALSRPAIATRLTSGVLPS